MTLTVLGPELAVEVVVEVEGVFVWMNLHYLSFQEVVNQI